MRSFLVLVLIAMGCGTDPSDTSLVSGSDIEILVTMIADRERAMIEKDIDAAMAQFADDATWINSQGYYFEGKHELAKFHRMLAEDESRDYYYETGEPKIRLIDPNNAIVYYSWKMFWFDPSNPADTTFREIGLMTLNALKQDKLWYWIAVTNQHTPWFYQTIEPVMME